MSKPHVKRLIGRHGIWPAVWMATTSRGRYFCNDWAEAVAEARSQHVPWPDQQERKRRELRCIGFGVAG